MAGTKTSALAALTTVADGDLITVVDVSDTTMAPTGTNKKVTADDFVRSRTVTGVAGHELVDVDPLDPRLPEQVADATLPFVVVKPSGDVTGAADNAAIAAAKAKVAAATAQGIWFGSGKFYVTATLDFTDNDDLYGMSIMGVSHGGNPADANPHGTQIVMLTDNVPIVKVWGAQRIQGLCLIYDSQQTTSDTSAIGLSMNNLAGARLSDIRVWRANIGFGIPQANFGATGYNTIFNSDFSNLHSHEASITHFDFRNFNGGGTNCRLGPLYVNGGGSLDFVTPGQSASYAIRLASAGGYEFGAISVDGMILNERLVDAASGDNTFTIDTIRCEAVDWDKDNDGLIVLGGSRNACKVNAFVLKNTKWTPAATTAMYLVRTNATINILDVGAVLVDTDCNFGGSGTRRALLNASSDADSDIKIHAIVDTSPKLSDTVWGDSVTTLQTPVRVWDGMFVNGIRKAGRAGGTHRFAIATAIPTTGTWAVDDEIALDGITLGLPTAYRCTTAGTPGTWRPIAQTVKKDTTANRPAPSASDIGVLYMDTTLDADGKPIWWNGTAWVDATGATV